MDKDLKMIELYYCAIEQGYGVNLKPMFKEPAIDLILHLELKKIADEYN